MMHGDACSERFEIGISGVLTAGEVSLPEVLNMCGDNK